MSWSRWLLTHVTIASRHDLPAPRQAHRALDLHPAVAHFFRFWLWLTTGMLTKEWVAIHRKHHAKVETPDDPHSPQTRGIETVFWRGTELYRAESKNLETIDKYGHGTPDDWIERNVYTRFGWQGVGLMLASTSMLFGPHRRHDLGRPDDVDPDHRRRHHQRHRPLLGLPQLRLRGRVDQHRALGHRDRRRRAAQQSPRVRHVGQALVAVVRVRHRLDVHPHPCGAAARHRAQGRAAAQVRPDQGGGRPAHAAGGDHAPLCGHDQLRALAEGCVRRGTRAPQDAFRRRRRVATRRTRAGSSTGCWRPGQAAGTDRVRARRGARQQQGARDRSTRCGRNWARCGSVPPNRRSSCWPGCRTGVTAPKRPASPRWRSSR